MLQVSLLPSAKGAKQIPKTDKRLIHGEQYGFRKERSTAAGFTTLLADVKQPTRVPQKFTYAVIAIFKSFDYVPKDAVLRILDTVKGTVNRLGLMAAMV